MADQQRLGDVNEIAPIFPKPGKYNFILPLM